MAYLPQPGTIQHRAIAWLKSMALARPGYEPSTAEICDAIGADGYGFSAYMRPAREQGAVHTRKMEGARVLFWRIGDESPDPGLSLRGADRPLNTGQPTFKPPQPGPILPGVAATVESEALRNEFRATEWDGHLLATGMEIRDGVAIFTPAMVREIKRRTEWLAA